MIFTLLFLATSAFIAGFIDSAAGGGGLITLPSLLAVNVPPYLALGTNKFQSMLGTSCALINYGRKSKVIWKVALIGIPFALVGSIIGAKMVLIIEPSRVAKIIIVLLPFAATAVLFSKRILKGTVEHLKFKTGFWITTISICFLIGAYDGFFGPGTGTFLIIALVLASHIPIVKASATAKAFNLASNVGAFVTFIISGNVNYLIGLVMAVFNIAGNFAGSHFAMKHEAKLIQKLVLLSLSLLFFYLIWKYFLYS